MENEIPANVRALLTDIEAVAEICGCAGSCASVEEARRLLELVLRTQQTHIQESARLLYGADADAMVGLGINAGVVNRVLRAELAARPKLDNVDG